MDANESGFLAQQAPLVVPKAALAADSAHQTAGPAGALQLSLADVIDYLAAHPHEAFSQLLPFLEAHISLQTRYRRAVAWLRVQQEKHAAAGASPKRAKFRPETPRSPGAWRRMIDDYGETLRTELCRVTGATACRVWLRLRRTRAEIARATQPLLYVHDAPGERVRCGDPASVVGRVAAERKAMLLAHDDGSATLVIPIFACADANAAAAAPQPSRSEADTCSDEEGGSVSDARLPEPALVLQGVAELKAPRGFAREAQLMASVLCCSAPVSLPLATSPAQAQAQAQTQTQAQTQAAVAPAGETSLVPAEAAAAASAGDAGGLSRARASFMRIAADALRQATRAEAARLADVELRHASLHQSLRDVSAIAKFLLCETELEPLISKIVVSAKDLLNVEGASVFLVDNVTNELYSLAFETEGAVPDGTSVKPRGAVRFPRDKGIIGAVAVSGVTEVVADAYANERFNRSWDAKTGFRTRNLLTTPVRNGSSELVGVLQLVNKKASAGFDDADVVLVETFAAYCGIGIHNARVLDDLRKERSRARLALEIMSLHVMPDPDQLAALLARPLPAIGDPAGPFAELDSVFFSTYTLGDDDLVLAILRMLVDAGVCETLRIDMRTALLFILAMRKSYRSVLYHNWQHAASVVHAMFCLLRLGDWHAKLTRVEVAALMVAAIGHDVDHRGENNAFHKKQNSELDILYDSSSPLERHHFSHTVMLIERTSLLANTDSAVTKTIFETIQKVILATDLARHFPNVKLLNSIIDRAAAAGRPIDLAEPETRDCMLAGVIVACDLNTAIKPWETHVTGAQRIYDEFFVQGDRERSFGLEPIEMMDRQRCRIPQQQLGFYDFIVRPLYAALVRVVPQYSVVLASAENNRALWAVEADKGASASSKPVSNEEPSHLPTH